MIWNILTAIATLVSMVAYIVTARYIHDELKGLEKDRYLNVTSELFSVWHTIEFMQAQLWLLHRMQETDWHGFVAAHRADDGEVAFHRVGAFYDRVGTLVRLGLINEQEILPIIGGWAISVWQKIAPLVEEARRIENSTLFSDFERMLPSCYECYVPSLGLGTPITTVMSMEAGSAPPSDSDPSAAPVSTPSLGAAATKSVAAPKPIGGAART